MNNVTSANTINFEELSKVLLMNCKSSHKCSKGNGIVEYVK